MCKKSGKYENEYDPGMHHIFPEETRTLQQDWLARIAKRFLGCDAMISFYISNINTYRLSTPFSERKYAPLSFYGRRLWNFESVFFFLKNICIE